MPQPCSAWGARADAPLTVTVTVARCARCRGTHRAFAGANILVDERGVAKLADFGWVMRRATPHPCVAARVCVRRRLARVAWRCVLRRVRISDRTGRASPALSHFARVVPHLSLELPARRCCCRPGGAVARMGVPACLRAACTVWVLQLLEATRHDGHALFARRESARDSWHRSVHGPRRCVS